LTVQVPPFVGVSTEPVSEQPAAPALTSWKVTAPVPWPPAVVSVSGVPNVPDVDVTVTPDPAPLANWAISVYERARL
jgi:hypothetical protein